MDNEKILPAAGVKPAGLSVTPVLIMIGIAVVWGANWAVVKIGSREFGPLFMAGLRSLIAGGCLAVWIRLKGLPLFPSRTIVFHGAVVGLIFGIEFALIYVGLQQTMASRVYVLIYTAPFFTALGAHFFLSGDRLNRFKAAGLVLAFSGILALFMDDLGRFTLDTLAGDLMIMISGGLWGGMTVYIKKFLTGRANPLQTLFFHFFFSLPVFFGFSAVWESNVVHDLSWIGVSSVGFQSLVVAFISYLVWTELIFRYPVSLVHAFSFITPVCGVVISGVLLLGEPVGLNLIAALILISLGLIMVNRR